jgi:hypothetical protein
VMRRRELGQGQETCVGRGALVDELSRMVDLLRRTDADEDRLRLLLRRRTLLEVPGLEVQTLSDATAVVPTTWIMSSRARVTPLLVSEHPDWLVEHDDARGVPCFAAADLTLVLSCASYDDALEVLGDAVTFLRGYHVEAETREIPVVSGEARADAA